MGAGGMGCSQHCCLFLCSQEEVPGPILNPGDVQGRNPLSLCNTAKNTTTVPMWPQLIALLLRVLFCP